MMFIAANFNKARLSFARPILKPGVLLFLQPWCNDHLWSTAHVEKPEEQSAPHTHNR